MERMNMSKNEIENLQIKYKPYIEHSRKGSSKGVDLKEVIENAIKSQQNEHGKNQKESK